MTVNATFRKRSVEWKFLKTPFSWFRVDGENTMTSLAVLQAYFNGKCTVAHKCTPNLNHSHYIQITRAEFKSPTPKIKSSHRIQITHTEFKNTRTKFKSLTPKIKSSHRIQITHTEFKNTRTKFKSLTPNSNHSHRIQITHTEFKSLTPN